MKLKNVDCRSHQFILQTLACSLPKLSARANITSLPVFKLSSFFPPGEVELCAWNRTQQYFPSFRGNGVEFLSNGGGGFFVSQINAAALPKTHLLTSPLAVSQLCTSAPLLQPVQCKHPGRRAVLAVASERLDAATGPDCPPPNPYALTTRINPLRLHLVPEGPVCVCVCACVSVCVCALYVH